MKFEKFDQSKEEQKGFYLLPVIAVGYGKAKALWFGWGRWIWTFYIRKD